MSRPAVSHRHALRRRLLDAHAEVEAAVGGFDSLADYRRYLRGMHAFRAPVEAAVAAGPWPEPFGGWRPCLIAGLVAADGHDLGVAIGDIVPPPPAPFDMAGLLGQLYVLEGSMLGAQILYRRAQELGMHSTYGARHLARQAADVANWQAFVALLERVEPFDLERTAAAADATFRAAASAFRTVVAAA